MYETENWSQEQRNALQALEQAIVAYDAEGARASAREVLALGIDPVQAMRTVLPVSAQTVGAKFDTGECFLPHLVMAADAMTAASEVLEQAIPHEQLQAPKVVVIGTVEGDVHSVGKNVVSMMLKAGGFEVHDLGVDVKSRAFVAKAREVNAHIIAASSLLTTTRPYQRELIEDLEAAGIREQFKIMVGGGPVTSEWAERIGADGYGRDAVDAVTVARGLVGLD